MQSHPKKREPYRWQPGWDLIDTILLDMDGTLLDKHFDDYFWEHYVPEIFAGKNDLTQTQDQSPYSGASLCC
jgi:FMN phosphatase YigB (HAD superfamily)